MKKVIFLAILTLGSVSFSASKDLRLFNALSRAGAQLDQAMSHEYVGFASVSCYVSSNSDEACPYTCELTDAANDSESRLEGKNAKNLIDALVKYGADFDSAMGKSYVSVTAVQCSQVSAGAADGTAADRTSCELTE